MSEKVLTKHIGEEGATTFKFYEKHGGYEALKKVLKKGMTPQDVIDEVKESGLRGCGGAGFPTGVKWGFVPKNTSKPIYLVCNADEGEPGTFKDRVIMENVPHQLVEGMIISSYAIGCNTAYIYLRGEFAYAQQLLERCIEDARRAGYIGKNILGSGFDFELYTHRGAGAYIVGEETALISSLEGQRGEPRRKPPFPAVEGAWHCPTIVNNVETLSFVPHIVLNGAQWFQDLGVGECAGSKLFWVSGHVEKPGVYELPMGVPMHEFIFEHAGGIRGGKKLKGVVPGGSSTPVLRADEIEIGMDFNSCAKAGTMLGSAGMIVMDETTCMVGACENLSYFYAHETCGQCSQCREGSTWLYKVIHRISAGEGRMEDLDLLFDMCDNMKGKTICVFSDAAAAPVESFINKFREDFENHIKNGSCSLTHY